MIWFQCEWNGIYRVEGFKCDKGPALASPVTHTAGMHMPDIGVGGVEMKPPCATKLHNHSGLHP
jgi:hypothetical protein